MKQYSAIISVVAAVVVLAAAWGIGRYIREVRLQRAGAVNSPKTAQAGKKPAPERPMPGPGPGRKQELSEQEKARLKEQRGKMIEETANMSEQEKEKFRAQVREKFSPSLPPDRRGFPQMSPEEMGKIKEQFEKMKEKWESMSEQEKEAFKAKMREGFGPGPQMERPASPNEPPKEAAQPEEKTPERKSESEEQK